MEPGAGGGSPVSTRVAQNIKAGDTVVSNGVQVFYPYRPRKPKDATYRCPPKFAVAEPDTTPPRRQDSEFDGNAKASAAAADALSLAGTTPPSSPTIMSSFPCDRHGLKALASESTRPQLVLIDSRGHVAAKDGNADEAPPRDAPFRKHTRGIGSIDSILSSTTCVNTHSDCSRPESQLSREIRVGLDDVDGGPPTLLCHLVPEQKNKGVASAHAEYRTRLVQPSTSASSSTVARWEHEHPEDEGLSEEERLADEISSLVLRNAFGKDVDDCPAPLLIWDCTSRYIRELSAAAHHGKLGHIQTVSGNGSPSSYGGAGGTTPTPGGGDQQPSDHHGKGKRKAEGSSEDGSGPGGGDDQGDEDRDMSPVSQAYSSKGSVISNFSCPYRKRNPLRFNVRDHYVCATHSFSDMSQLKKHIRAHHPPVQRNAGPFLCPRCCHGFFTKNDLDSHLRRLDVCRLSYDSGGTDPEDGITQKIISSLEARSLKAKVDNWASLWKLLFPNDETIPDPFFVPVMEVFDFIAESKKFLTNIRDLLEIQYRYVLEGASQAMDVDVKIRQGLERSVQSIYNWVETVVQDWEHRISGTVSPFTSSAVSQPAMSDSWASTPQLPPSPAQTPTVASQAGNATGAGNLPCAESTAPRGALARRRPNPPPKRVKMPEILPKIQPATQIPVPVQRARTPQPHTGILGSDGFRPPRAVLPSQSVPNPTSTPSTFDSRPPYPTSWEVPTTASNPSAYSVPYTSSPGGVFQHHPALGPTHYAPTHHPQHQHHHHNQLNAGVQPYLGGGPDHQQPVDAVPVPPETLQQQHEVPVDVPNPQPPPCPPGNNNNKINRHMSSMSSSVRASATTPRSSLASLTSWMRDNDSNRDSSQTLVEAHPPGRCRDLYCPSCSKAPLSDVVDTNMTGGPPVAYHNHQHHRGAAFETVEGAHQVPFPTPVSSSGAGAVGAGEAAAHHFHGVAEQVEWGFGGNDNVFGGGGHGPQEGY